MAHVFISYTSEDKAAADRLCEGLESQNIACWIAPRNIPAGTEWPTAIVEAIGACKAFISILSSHSIQTKQLAREVEIADKRGCQILAFRIENVEPPPALNYFVGNIQWLDAFGDQFNGAVARVVQFVEKTPETERGYLPTQKAIPLPDLAPSGDGDSIEPQTGTLPKRGPKVKPRTDLDGDWLSLSQTGEIKGAVRDTVIISARQGKLYLQNRDKIGGFDYEASCDVYEKMMLVGPWRSVRPGALARGYLLLQIASQGQYMYGVYSGIHSDGHHMLLGWALGRDEDSLKQAVETLRSSSSLDFTLP
jgi:TIR domain